MESLDEAGLPNDERFRRSVRSHLEFGAQVAQQNSWAETDADASPTTRGVPLVLGGTRPVVVDA